MQFVPAIADRVAHLTVFQRTEYARATRTLDPAEYAFLPSVATPDAQPGAPIPAINPSTMRPPPRAASGVRAHLGTVLAPARVVAPLGVDPPVGVRAEVVP